jgi:hypothetical protein
MRRTNSHTQIELSDLARDPVHAIVKTGSAVLEVV